MQINKNKVIILSFLIITLINTTGAQKIIKTISKIWK